MKHCACRRLNGSVLVWVRIYIRWYAIFFFGFIYLLCIVFLNEYIYDGICIVKANNTIIYNGHLIYQMILMGYMLYFSFILEHFNSALLQVWYKFDLNLTFNNMCTWQPRSLLHCRRTKDSIFGCAVSLFKEYVAILAYWFVTYECNTTIKIWLIFFKKISTNVCLIFYKCCILHCVCICRLNKSE